LAAIFVPSGVEAITAKLGRRRSLADPADNHADGCAIATVARHDFLICRHAPADDVDERRVS